MMKEIAALKGYQRPYLYPFSLARVFLGSIRPLLFSNGHITDHSGAKRYDIPPIQSHHAIVYQWLLLFTLR